MRIAFISSYPPSKEGVGKYTQSLVSALASYNHEVHVVTFSNNEESGDKNIHRVISLWPKGLIETWSILKKIDADIIHVQFAIPIFRLYSFILWPLLYFFKKNSHVKVFSTLHEPSREIKYLGIFGRIFYWFLCRTCDEINVLTSESLRIINNKCRVPISKIKLIKHGIYVFSEKIDNSKIIRKRLGLSELNKVVLFFGYIHIDKGIEYLIEAFEKLTTRQIHSDLVLVLAGVVRPRKGLFKIFQKIDEKYEQKILKLIKEKSLSGRVIFSGYVEDKEIYSFMKLGQVLVLPYSKGEQSGVLNMALSCEIPIVASDIGGFHDSLSESGVLVDPGNVNSITASLEKILSADSYEFKKNLLLKYKEHEGRNSIKSIIENQIERYKIILAE